MTDVRKAAGELLESDPAFEDGLRELLEVDQRGSWEFDDIPLDSGQFGEVVSSGIAESVGGGYRLTDPAAVEAALAGEEYVPTDETETSGRLESILPAIDPRWAGLLLAALLLVVLVRVVFVWQYVYKNGDVVLLKNDPWFYRYWTETLLSSDLSAWNVGALGNLPNGVTGGSEVLFIVTLWWAAALLGGTPQAAGTVVAWYPVLVAVVVMVMVYLIATRVGKDKRVGLAAVLVGSVFGIVAQRTALGFGDHHAFDFVWLALGLLSITVLVDGIRSIETRDEAISYLRTHALPIAGLGIAIAAQVASWPAGAILILPIGGVAFFTTLAAIRRGYSPAFGNAPLIVGTAIGAIVTYALDSGFGWLSPDRVLAPAVLFAGVLAVTAIGEIGFRSERSTRTVAGIEIALGIAGFAVVWFFVPDLAASFQDMIRYFQGLAGADISETIPLLGPRAGIFMGPIYHFGLVFYLIIPYMGWGIWAVFQDDQPLVQVPAAVYGIFFFVFALVQFRFAFHLGLPTAVLGGLGFVHLASEFDLADPPNVFMSRSVNEWRTGEGWTVTDRISMPTPRDTMLLVVLFVFLLNFALLTIPLGFNNFAVSDETYETATWIETDAQERGLEYPDSYVLTPWSENRLYNYFASGEARSYGYAQSNYEDFLRSSEPETWYERLRNRPVGYVVTTDSYSGEPGTMYARLHDRMGSETGEVQGLSHYRGAYVSPSGDQKVFTLVPGATIEGVGPATSSTTVETPVTVGDHSFTYQRTVETGPDGAYSLTVPYPGDYTVFDRTVTVNESAVENGQTVSA